MKRFGLGKGKELSLESTDPINYGPYLGAGKWLGRVIVRKMPGKLWIRELTSVLDQKIEGDYSTRRWIDMLIETENQRLTWTSSHYERKWWIRSTRVTLRVILIYWYLNKMRTLFRLTKVCKSLWNDNQDGWSDIAATSSGPFRAGKRYLGGPLSVKKMWAVNLSEPLSRLSLNAVTDLITRQVHKSSNSLGDIHPSSRIPYCTAFKSQVPVLTFPALEGQLLACFGSQLCQCVGQTWARMTVCHDFPRQLFSKSEFRLSRCLGASDGPRLYYQILFVIRLGILAVSRLCLRWKRIFMSAVSVHDDDNHWRRQSLY
jgi:hypothetical protein